MSCDLFQDGDCFFPDHADIRSVVFTSGGNCFFPFEQPDESTFEIMSVEEFTANEQGQKTWKLGINVNCTLIEITDNPIEPQTLMLSNLSGTTAFAIPDKLNFLN